MNLLNLDTRGRLVNLFKLVPFVLIFSACSVFGLPSAQAQTLPLCNGSGGGAESDLGPFQNMGLSAAEATLFIENNPPFTQPHNPTLVKTWRFDKVCERNGEFSVKIVLENWEGGFNPTHTRFYKCPTPFCTEEDALGLWKLIEDCTGKKAFKQTKTGTGGKKVTFTSDGTSMKEGGTYTAESCLRKIKVANNGPCPDCDKIKDGSIIRVEGQVLGQSMPITGTPFNLVYNTDRTPGYLSDTSLQIPLTESVVPDSLKRIEVTVDVAGRRYTIEYDTDTGNAIPDIAPDLTHDFTWDGLDAYGRQVSGTVKAKVRIQFFNESQKAAYSILGPQLFRDAATLDSFDTRLTQPNVQEYTTTMEVKDHRANGLGGWSIDANHVYDARGEILHMGGGTRMSSQDLPDVITTINGGQVDAKHIVTDSKGNLYFSDTAGHKIKKIDLQGNVTDVVGTGTAGDAGNNPAVNISQTIPPIKSPTYLAIDIHDNLYFYDSGNFRIRKVDFAADEMVSLVGRGFLSNPLPNNSIAKGEDTALWDVKGLAVDASGVVYFIPLFDNFSEQIYRILSWSTDGFVRNHFGELDSRPYLVNPISLAADPEGNLYIADFGSFNPSTGGRNNPNVYKLSNLGVRVPLAGNGEDNDGTNTVDGVQGTQSPVRPKAIAFRNGKLYIADRNRVRVVSTDGIISTIAGPGDSATGVKDNYPAVSSEIEPVSIAFDLIGNPLVVDATTGSESIRKIASPLPSILDGTVKIPSSDGSQLYEFDSSGRHLNTKSTLTGATLLTFNYDSAGKLDSIVDGDGDTTDFVYDSNGDLEKIVSEDGLETLTEPDGHGFLASLTYPNTLYDEVIDFEYDPNGLMESMDDAKDNTHLFRYNSKGQLQEDENPEGGILALERNVIAPGEYEIKTTSPEGREEFTKVTTLSDSGKRATVSTDSNGFETITTLNKDQSATAVLPDETEITSSKSPDERFGFISPLASIAVKLPSTNEYNLEKKRTFTPPITPGDPFTFTSVKNELIIGKSPNEVRTFESVFTKATNTFVSKSATTPPRITTTEINNLGRITHSHIEEIIDADFKYDLRGRLEFIRQGCESPTTCVDGRETGILYNTDGFVDSVTDALGQITSFEYDKLGRVTEQTLPTSTGILPRKVVFEYDQNGNLESLTPPGRPAHTYLHTALDLEEEYTPPDHPDITIERTKYDYNADQQAELITRPDGLTIDLNYDTGGRLKEYITSDGSTTEFKYFETATDTESFSNLKSITAFGTPNETLTFAYDGSLLKSTTWGGTVSGFISRTHDSNFRVDSQKVTDGASPAKEVLARFAYDEDNLLESVKYDPDGTADNGDEFELDLLNNTLNGLLTGTEMKNDTSPTPVVKVTDSYRYFNILAVAPEPNDKGYGEVYEYKASYLTSERFKTVFERDKLGRIEKKTETLNGGTPHVYEYTYYPEGMLDEVKIDSVVVRDYEYDANFNRVSTDGGATTNAVYDVQDRLKTYAGNTYAYNDNGELASKTNASGTTTYLYDVLGNLKEVDPPQSNDKIEYVVDGQNRRIAKKVDGTITRKWLYSDQLNPIAELDLNDNITKRFIYATANNVPDVVVDVSGANPVVYRIISDHLGSPRFVIYISNGITALDLEYDEWGVETLISGNRDLIPFGFAGGHYDPDTKLVRFGARDYDPEIGRWTSKDPIEFEGGDTNLFGYVLNDPINSIDPTGNCPWCLKYGVDFTIEVILQLMANGGRIECVNWGEAGKNAVEGFFWPPGLSKVTKAANKFNNSPYIKKRPYLRKDTQKDSWDKSADGTKPNSKKCPDCGKDVNGNPHKGEKRNGPDGWDVDHIQKWEVVKRNLEKRGASASEYRDAYNSLNNTRLKCPHCNRSDNQL